MSGGYTHITLAQLAIEKARFQRKERFHEEARGALGRWKKYCIVGAVAPDYPYLDVLDSGSTAWADAMHKGGAVELLRGGVAAIRGIEEVNVRDKCTAWLFGFAAHVSTDGTIHPVVNLKVGPYEENKAAHRRCEMSQDVYAQERLNLGALDFNRQISTNVDGTSHADDDGRMDPDVARLWAGMLRGVYPHLGEPKIDDWHRAMRALMRVGESGDKLFPFVRHVAANQGLVYPARPEATYINALAVPGGATMGFEAIFERALANILDLWEWLALSLRGEPSPLDTLKSWSLDSGIDEEDRMVYWS